MKLLRIFPLVFVLFLVQIAFTQTDAAIDAAPKDPAKAEEDAEKRRELALAMIKETGVEIESLQSISNRIAFSANLADIAYDYDPDFSRRMFLGLTNDVSRKVASAYSQISESMSADPSSRRHSSTGAAMSYLSFLRLSRLRSAVISAAGRHDPLLGLEVFERTKFAGPPAANDSVREFESIWNASGENLLAGMIAGLDISNAETTGEFGRRILKDGLSKAAVTLLKKIRDKDAVRGAEYARDVYSSAGREMDRLKPDLPAIDALIEYSTQELKSNKNENRAHPLVSRAEVRDLAERFGRLILRTDENEIESYMVVGYAASISPYSPAIAGQIAKKFGLESESGNATYVSSMAAPPPPPPPAPSTDGMADGDGAKEGTVGGDSEDLREKTERARQEELLKKMELPEDDPDKAAAARQFTDEGLRGVDEIRDPVGRVEELIGLARMLRLKGFKELSAEVMDEAFRSVTNNPRRSSEYLQVWKLAVAVSETDPNRGFGMVEDLIFRLNDVAAAFVKFGEFIDLGGELVDDDELQFSGIGPRLFSGLGSNLDGSGEAIKNFAEADLARTRALPDRFDRPEIRVAARLLILQSLFGKEDEKKPETGEEEYLDVN